MRSTASASVVRPASSSLPPRSSCIRARSSAEPRRQGVGEGGQPRSRGLRLGLERVGALDRLEGGCRAGAIAAREPLVAEREQRLGRERGAALERALERGERLLLVAGAREEPRGLGQGLARHVAARVVRGRDRRARRVAEA